MPRKDVDHKRLRIRKSAATSGTGVQVIDRTFVVVTQAFCPRSHNVVGAGTTVFDGYAGIAIWVSDGRSEGLVELSPIHGDRTKVGPSFPPGTHLRLECPVCRTELPYLARCTCQPNGTLRKLYLTRNCDEGYLIGLCDVWDCTRSRVIDGNEILSEWLAGRILDAD